MDLKQAIKNRIYDLCRERDITPNGLSYMCGISQATIKSVLNDESLNPTVRTIKRICDGFGITLAEFFDTEEFNHLEQEIK